jgi:hypothetical protein
MADRSWRTAVLEAYWIGRRDEVKMERRLKSGNGWRHDWTGANEQTGHRPLLGAPPRTGHMQALCLSHPSIDLASDRHRWRHEKRPGRSLFAVCCLLSISVLGQCCEGRARAA